MVAKTSSAIRECELNTFVAALAHIVFGINLPMLVFLTECFQALVYLIEGQQQKQRRAKFESSAILIESGTERGIIRDNTRSNTWKLLYGWLRERAR